jgi:circadian clock protein KaiB
MNSKGKTKAAKASSKKAKRNTASELQKTLVERYVLRLYVTGATPNSVRAIENIKAVCAEYLDGRYDVEIIDVYKQPSLAMGEQIVATPTLVKVLPLPLRRLVGDLSQKDRLLVGLDLVPMK